MIDGGDFNIRHIRKEDLAELIALLNSPEIRGEYLAPSMVSPVEIERKFAQDGISNETFERFLIVDKTDQMLGTIFHFKSVPYYNAREIGYTIFSAKNRNTGIASKAVKLLTRHLFDTLLINRLEIRTHCRNLASEKVAIKCGFKKEGVARGANFVRGKNGDMNVYALLRDEVQM